jgi:hypothetical protein
MKGLVGDLAPIQRCGRDDSHPGRVPAGYGPGTAHPSPDLRDVHGAAGQLLLYLGPHRDKSAVLSRFDTTSIPPGIAAASLARFVVTCTVKRPMRAPAANPVYYRCNAFLSRLKCYRNPGAVIYLFRNCGSVAA